MPLLNTAKNVKWGGAQVWRVYKGAVLVWEYQKATTISLSASATTINYGSGITLTATPTAGVPLNSTVRFRSGSPSGTIVATSTSSPWQVTVNPGASTTYYAEFVENPPWKSSTSGGVAVTVNYPTSISLAASAASINNGEAVTLTATVTGATSGTVYFRSGSASGAIAATASVSGGRAVATVSPGAATTYYAQYVANGNYLGSTSGGVAVAVYYPTSISLAASTGTINNGQAATLTAYVSGAASGTVYFWSNGAIIGSAGVSGGAASIAVAPGVSTSYQAQYVANGYYLASTSNYVTISVYYPTSISLAASTGTINNGQSLTLTAYVGGAPSGTVYFRAGSPSGGVVATAGVAGGAASVGVAPGGSTTYYAEYVANGAYLGSTSNGVGVTVRQLVTKTWSGNASWSQSYDGDSTQRTDAGSYLYYGYYSSIHGNQRSLIGFSVPNLSSAVSVTSVRLKFYNRHHYNNSGGNIPIGTHTNGSKPTKFGSASTDLQQNGSAPKPGWVDMTLNATIRSKFLSGAKGIALGPGPSTSNSYYGYADNHSSSNKPWLEIKYTIWE
jgi:hypothetical protein